MTKRASMFGAEPPAGDDLDASLDVGALKPGPIHRPDPGTARQAAEADGFVSRDSAPTRQDTQRRHRTGRTVQVNLKMTPAFKERFVALADQAGVSQNVTFERAIEALERQAQAPK
jgi:hypothetical protein